MVMKEVNVPVTPIIVPKLVQLAEPGPHVVRENILQNIILPFLCITALHETAFKYT
jgi:hypothetical protein